MDIRKLQRAIVDGLEDVKAHDIVVYNTERLSPLFERVIIASGTSNRQTKALASGVREAVRAAGFPVLATEGGDNGEWIIVDCGAAVAHIMQPAIRDYYRLEEIWGGKPVRMKLGSDLPRGLVKASEGEADEVDEDDAPMAPQRKAAARKGAKAAPAAPAPPARQARAAKTTPGPRAAAKAAAAKPTAPAKKAAGKTVAAKKSPARKTAAPAAPAAKVQTIVVKPVQRRSAAAKTPAARPAPARKAAGKVPSKGPSSRAAVKKAAPRR